MQNKEGNKANYTISLTSTFIQLNENQMIYAINHLFCKAYRCISFLI